MCAATTALTAAPVRHIGAVRHTGAVRHRVMLGSLMAVLAN
jgi:hypothetical protein